MSETVEEYRKFLVKTICQPGKHLIIYCGDNDEKNIAAREANHLTRLHVDDRRRILKHYVVKSVKLEDWL